MFIAFAIYRGISTTFDFSVAVYFSSICKDRDFDLRIKIAFIAIEGIFDSMKCAVDVMILFARLNEWNDLLNSFTSRFERF